MKADTMNRYRAFGLNIESDVRLDELRVQPDAHATTDLTIAIKNIGYEIKPLGQSPAQFFYEDPEGFTMVWPGAAAIRIIGPQNIHIQPFAGVPESYLPFPLLGPVMAWILHLRKFLVLHASAVSLNGRSIAFMGDKMAGKSTTAASFIRAGAELLTDDLLAIEMTNPTKPTVMPAFPQIKLTESSANDIDLPGSKILPLVMEGFEKRQYKLSSMHDQPVACDFLFVIERGGAFPAIKWFDNVTSMTSLMRYSYSVRFGGAPIEMQDRPRHFAQCAGLARHARVGRLTIPVDVERLPETVDFVEKML